MICTCVIGRAWYVIGRVWSVIGRVWHECVLLAVRHIPLYPPPPPPGHVTFWFLCCYQPHSHLGSVMIGGVLIKKIVISLKTLFYTFKN